jgi:hypothetical protein
MLLCLCLQSFVSAVVEPGIYSGTAVLSNDPTGTNCPDKGASYTVIIIIPNNASVPPSYMDGFNGDLFLDTLDQSTKCLDGSTCKNARCYDGSDCETNWSYYTGPARGPGCGNYLSYGQSVAQVLNGTAYGECSFTKCPEAQWNLLLHQTGSSPLPSAQPCATSTT